MIHVSNDKRVFIKYPYINDSEYKKVLVIIHTTIKQIELNKLEYKDLDDLKINEKMKKNISIYYYSNLIKKTIDNLIKEKIKDKSFIKELEDIKKNIYLLLIGDFQTIKKFIEDKINSKTKSLLINTTCDKIHKRSNYYKYSKAFSLLYEKTLSGKIDFKMGFFHLFKDISVCPYCNRNFINPIYIKQKELLGCNNSNQAPDIEHFFPKSMYPFLSLSISNLLPSCSFCNKIKSNFDTYPNTLSPYEIKENNFKFNFSLNTKLQYEVDLETTKDNKKLFNLDGFYETVHNKHLNEIFFDLKKEANENYLESIATIFNTNDESKKDTIKKNALKKEVYYKIFRNYFDEDEHNKYPLAKLTKDFYIHLTKKI